MAVTTDKLKHAHSLSDSCGLTDDERRSFTEMAVGVESWRELSGAQLERLVDHLRGAHFFVELMVQRP